MNKLLESELFQSLKNFFSRLVERLSDIKILNYSPSKRVVAIGFGVVVGLLVIISGIFVLGELRADKDEELLTTETTLVPEVVASAPATKEFDSTFLFALTDNDSTLVHSVMVVSFDSQAESLQFRFVDPDTSVTVNETTGTIHSHLADGGISEFLWAVSSHTGVGFSRYMVIRESDFVKLVSMVGDTEIEIESSVSYAHDGISFIIDKGTQTLTPDIMLKYCLYLSSAPQSNADKIAEVCISILGRLFTVEDDEDFHNTCSSALSLFTTDLSAIDFTDHKDAVYRIPSMHLSENVSFVTE